MPTNVEGPQGLRELFPLGTVRHYGTAGQVKKKRVIRDGQVSKVYAAERAAFPESYNNLPKDMKVPEVQAYVNKLLREQWSRRRWGNRSVDVTDGRGRRQAVSMGGEIRLPLWARDPITILHELAHELCPREEWHGPIFTRTYLELVGHKLGAEAQARLRAEYKTRRVKVGSPLKLRALARVPAAPVVLTPKLWRIEYKQKGLVKTASFKASSLTSALNSFLASIALSKLDITNLKIWRGVERKTVPTRRAAAKPRPRTR